jgi:hypothetical protein
MGNGICSAEISACKTPPLRSAGVCILLFIDLFKFLVDFSKSLATCDYLLSHLFDIGQ